MSNEENKEIEKNEQEEVEFDVEKACEWYEKAAENGNAQAMCLLGYCYREGVGVQQDHAKAFDLTKEAAEAGNAMAQFNLGLCYEKGLGVDADSEQSALWYEKAKANGYTE